MMAKKRLDSKETWAGIVLIIFALITIFYVTSSVIKGETRVPRSRGIMCRVTREKEPNRFWRGIIFLSAGSIFLLSVGIKELLKKDNPP
ncbi:hypothetical protein ACFL38_02265 [Candidatus Omnitrophota bacterium]